MRCDQFGVDLDRWLAGDTPPGSVERMRRHAGSCPGCRAEWDRARALGALLAEASAPSDEAGVVRRARDRLRGALDRSGHPTVRFGAVSTSVGPVFVGVSDRGVCDVTFCVSSEAEYRARLLGWAPEARRDDGGTAEVRAQLAAYFGGALTRFAVDVDLRRVTPFTAKVLRAARRIGFGTVTSYGRLAARIGRPGASRAVGGALGRNPVPIIIPCHRVLASGGRLGGFTGGVETKRALLRLEGHALPDRRAALFT